LLYGLGRKTGRTRILTDNPEKLKIDEDYIRREEKEGRNRNEKLDTKEFFKAHY
jgi:hypothetical protein